MLSGGQMQRVALARSMAMEPAVMLLDEPLSNLDARLRDDLRVEFRRIQVERGLTSLYVTHDQQEALSLGDLIAIMQGGRITQLGTPEEIYQYPASASIARFLGVTNIFPIDISDTTAVRLAASGQTLVSEDRVPTGPSSACIRPEHVAVSCHFGGPSDASPEVNEFRGVVEVAIFQGASIRCKVVTESGLRLEAISPPPVSGTFVAGTEVIVRVAARDVRLLPEDVSRATEKVAVAA